MPDSLMKAMPAGMLSNVRPSNRSGAWTVWPAARSSSAKALTPGVRPWAWWNRRTSVMVRTLARDRDRDTGLDLGADLGRDLVSPRLDDVPLAEVALVQDVPDGRDHPGDPLGQGLGRIVRVVGALEDPVVADADVVRESLDPLAGAAARTVGRPEGAAVAVRLVRQILRGAGDRAAAEDPGRAGAEGRRVPLEVLEALLQPAAHVHGAADDDGVVLGRVRQTGRRCDGCGDALGFEDL